MARYAIWNKQDPVYTPVGELFTADEWFDRYPIARLDSITVVCAAGEINGGFFSTLGQMVDSYAKQGCDFSACTTNQEKLDAIEAFEDAREAEAAQAAADARATEEMNAASTASIAASLEYQNMMTLEDVEV